MNLKKNLFLFLNKYNREKKTFLLGLSGGPDSRALFEILLSLSKEEGYTFAIAHVDHNWREESQKEAKDLENLAKEKGIPFFLETLKPTEFKGNLEAYCRKRRLSFFRKVVEENGYLGVFLAHHADDLAEGVLKGLFEGKKLASLCSLKEKNEIDGLIIFRPFLKVQKKDLLAWLEEKNVEYFHDETNLSPKLLRGRMRTYIFPKLQTSFGKEISSSLLKISEESEELASFLNSLVNPYLKKIRKGLFGSYLDLEDFPFTSLLPIKHLLSRFAKQEGASFSNEIFQQAAKALLVSTANKRWKVQEGELLVDRNKVFLISSSFLKRFFLKNKSFEINSGLNKGILDFSSFSCDASLWKYWKMKVVSDEETSPFTGGWQEVWQGKVEVTLPQGNYYLSNPKERSERMNRLWTMRGVPSFVRHVTPLIMDEQGKAYEALSGRLSYDFHKIKKRTRVILEFSSKDSFC